MATEPAAEPATEPAADTAAWQLPEKWTEDTVDETGNKLSKRYCLHNATDAVVISIACRHTIAPEGARLPWAQDGTAHLDD